MSRFIITCPVCHNYAEASTGFFASKHIRCSCGNIINVKTDRMATMVCPGCGNNVVYDQAEGKNAKCPVTRSSLRITASTIWCISAARPAAVSCKQIRQQRILFARCVTPTAMCSRRSRRLKPALLRCQPSSVTKATTRPLYGSTR